MVEVLRYINSHLNSKIYLKDMAALAGFSLCHFCEKFKEYTGENFKDYVKKRQMQAAMKEILAGKSTLEIAASMGYESRWGFTRAFIREFGVTPAQFKQEAHMFLGQYEKRRHETRQLSSRCEILRERAAEGGHNRAARGQRLYFFVKGYYDVPKEKRSYTNLMGASLASVLSNAAPVIEPYELIVGYNYDGGNYFPEVDASFINTPEGRRRTLSYLKDSLLTKEQLDWLTDKLMSAEDRFQADYTNNLQLLGFQLPPTLSREEAGLIKDGAAVGCCSVNHHALIDYEKVLKFGFEGLGKWVRECRDKRLNGHGSELLSDAEKTKLHDFYESLLSVCSAASAFGVRYAKEAKRLLETETDPQKREDLMKIQEICTQVPRYPAETFAQAVQCIWFTTIFNTWEDGINGNSLGRLDQLLYPYYRNDIACGRITEGEALEWICMLLLKLYSKDNHQQIVIGGCDENRNSAVNTLSYLFLDAVEALDVICNLSVRYSPRTTEHAFLRRAFEVLGHTQNGIPVFFNDDVIIPSLITHGISPADADRYAAVGCVEIAIPGKSNQHSATGQCNLLKSLEYAMNQGKSMCSTELFCGPDTGLPECFHTFSQLLQAVKLQLKHMIDTVCKIINYNIPIAAAVSPVPLKSLLVDDCISSGKDYNAGGPMYNYYQVMLLGFPNLIDSLAAIRTIVYERQECTLKYVADQMRENFPDERLRQKFLNKAPKYGNNFKDINALAAELFGEICDMVYANRSAIGQGFHAQLYTYIWNIDFGKNTAATPDGRHKGDPLAVSVSPVCGCDFSGLSALLSSLAALPNEKAPGIAAAVIDLEPYLLCDAYMEKVLGAFLSASEDGLAYAQFSVSDQETLIKAKKQPQHYQDLTVSVSGFSRKFIELDDSVKEQILTRAKQSTL